MVLDTGTMIAILIALAGSCFVMVVGIRAQGQLHRVINQKNEKIRFLEGEISKLRREKVESR
jgi:ABC-type long-subunit fatty acid transport system fused permease/ATPase subunit